MRMSDWSSDVCSADLRRIAPRLHEPTGPYHRLDAVLAHRHAAGFESLDGQRLDVAGADHREHHVIRLGARTAHALAVEDHPAALRRAGVNGEDQPRRHAPSPSSHMAIAGANQPNALPISSPVNPAATSLGTRSSWRR